MFNRLARQYDGRPWGGFPQKQKASPGSAGLRALAILAGLLLLLQPACLFKKHKTATPAVPPTIVRIVYLPLNPANQNRDIRWVALAVPAIMAKFSESAPDLETVPFWEMMPIALEAAGNSRIITDQTAAYIASRLTAKWAAQGEFSPAKREEVLLTVDFIPTKPTTVPFRYEKAMHTDSLGKNFFDAIEQFLRYLVARPMPRGIDRSFKDNSLKAVAEALDREYGWFVPAEPGKAGKVVENLIHSDAGLAKLLFNPSVYPSLATPAKPPKPAAIPPASAAPPTAGQSVTPPKEVKPQQEPDTASAPAPAPSGQFQDNKSLPTETPPPSTLAPPRPKELEAPKEREATAPSSAAVPQPPAPPPKETTASEPAIKATPPQAAKHTFRIQVGSFQGKDEAEACAGRLIDEGYAATVERADLQAKGIWYRVRLQGYKSREAAEAAGRKLLEAKLITQFWLVP